MKRGMISLMAALGAAALISGGCANKEVVKSEEPVVTTAPKTEPTQPEPPKPVEQPKAPAAEQQQVEQPKMAEAETPKASAAEAVLETVYFDLDRSDLRQDTRDVLNRNAETLLKSQPNAKVKIEGHCDERGSAEYNLALGERRAKSALQYLLTLGVKPERLSIVSYGKEKPAVDGHDEAAWAKNRRAEFVIIK
ncbi:peptidoglycan-associated lipoprotein Pal [Pelotalea chapellei]|uniref:Peptidoglycan-associated lipoprotein n=1 Tax=Pelotalea chapellei TaxID=44671 RepID=A0ABS5U526_9BACT|nr:peptidoglycan-associated lipoprotein Pal [Pelotalea chapellei]MBT1070754.1 peptidoglycan-associated lipoprotein Pal [Pelotalea chapellei]